MVDRKGCLEFWVPDEELKKLRDNEDHYFVFSWDHTSKEPVLVLYIDGDRAALAKVKKSTRGGRDVRLSSEFCDDAYVKATYISQMDEFHTFGEEESIERKDAEK